MQVPLQVSYRDVPKTDALENLIREKVAKLEQFCDHINSCRVAVERAHEHPSHGSPFRVRIDLTVPPGHELAVVKNPAEGNQYDPVDSVIRDAFEAARRQLVSLNRKQQGQVKQHPNQAMTAIVTQLFPEENYGFLKTLEGQDVYFNRNSVLHDDFDRLEIGTGVRFMMTEAEEGPRATTIQIVNKPGSRISKTDDHEQSEEVDVDPPAGWQ